MILFDIDFRVGLPVARLSTTAIDELASEAMMKRLGGPRDDPNRPLCIDLDDTLISTRLLSECALALLVRSPSRALQLLFWMAVDSRRATRYLLECAAFGPLRLPFRSRLLQLLRHERERGRSIFLTSGAPPAIADAIVNKLGLFSGAIHLPEQKEKRAVELCGRFGAGNFDYIGHAEADLPIWRTANAATLVAPSQSLVRDSAWRSQPATVLSPRPGIVGASVMALRIPAWLKNVLVFFPIITGADLADFQITGRLYLAFVAFCAIASAGYLINDLTDISSDRRHPTKRRRPIARGRLPYSIVLYMVGLLLAVGISLAAFLSPLLAAWMASYLAASVAYSLWLKRLMLTDIFVLAYLYVQRLLAGYIAITQMPPVWPTLFAGFFFLSLAALHRRLEQKNRLGAAMPSAARYGSAELQFVALFGLSAGFLAALIPALYAGTASAAAALAVPQLLYFCTPAIVFFIGQLWLRAERQQPIEDPFAFTLAAPETYAVTTFCALLFIAANLAPEKFHAWSIFNTL